jgi:hypothetical protein
MSTRQLKELFEAGLASPAADTIDVDAAIARGRRRRRTRVGATVLASAAAVVVAGLLVAGVLPPRTTGSIAPGDGTPLPIPTSQWREGDAGMAALLKGVLMLRSDRCLVVVSPEAETVIAWPAGFTAVQRDGGVDVLGGDGSVVARTGEQISLGGGEGRVGVVGPCLGGPAPVFAVNQAPPYDRSPATATPATWTPVQSVDDLQGTWLATTLGGEDVAGAVDHTGAPLVLVVDGSALRATDGRCNDIEESIRVEGEGDVVLGSQSMTAVGCDLQRPGWPAAGTAAYDARSAQVRDADGDAPRRLRLFGDGGSLLGEYVEVPSSTRREATAGSLCLQELASGAGLVDVTHARSTTVGIVRELSGGGLGPATFAKIWPGVPDTQAAAWCTSRVGSTWSISAVSSGAVPATVVKAGTPLGDPGTAGPPIP